MAGDTGAAVAPTAVAPAGSAASAKDAAAGARRAAEGRGGGAVPAGSRAEAVQERRLVEAALRPREALDKAFPETPERMPVPHEPARTLVPPLFAMGYAGYLGSARGAEPRLGSGGAGADGQPSGEQAAARDMEPEQAAARDMEAASLRSARLRVLPSHRHNLSKVLCRAVLFHFLQDRRQALGLGSGEPPLWLWEARRAQEHSSAGDVGLLVKYLAETELHIEEGPERRARLPGSAPPWQVAARLRAERRRLVPGWGMATRDLPEDAVFRVFLDGRLSWPRVRALLLKRPNGAEGAPAGGAGSA